MTAYLITFALALFFIYEAQRCKSGSMAYWVNLLMAMLIPALLAGLRDNTIGTDILTYVDDTWEAMGRIDSLSELFKKRSEDYFGLGSIGYLLLNYYLRTLSDNPHIVYFGISFFTLFFIVLAVKDNKGKASMPLMLFLFLFLYYNLSLNMMRQMMAMAVGLYSYKYLEREHWLKLALCVAVMYMFHPTSFAFLLCIILYLMYYTHNKLLKVVLFTGVMSLLLISFRYYNDILTMVLNYELIPAHYSLYFSKEEGVFQTSMLIMYFSFLCVFAYVWRKTQNKDRKDEVLYYTIFHLFATLFSMLSLIMYDAYRLAVYLLIISIIIFLPRTLAIAKTQCPKIYPMLLMSVVSLTVVVWYYINIYLGQNETYPYKSAILGIG